MDTAVKRQRTDAEVIRQQPEMARQATERARIAAEEKRVASPTITRVRCDHCNSRLDIIETQSGGRSISVAGLGPSVEAHPLALERFDFGSSREITCPACNRTVNPMAPNRSGQS
jgi:ribosomal protein S27E